MAEKNTVDTTDTQTKIEVEVVEQRMLSVRNAAKYTDLSISTVRRLIAQKAFPHHRVGGKILVDKKDLDAHIDARKA